MEDQLGIWFRVGLAFLLAVAGGVGSVLLTPSHKRLCGLISLAAGTLLGVTVFSILPESWHALGLWRLAAAVLSGYVVFFLISKYVSHVCPACAASHFDEAATHRFSEIASALIVALAIHSTMDGLAIAAGSDHGHGHEHVSAGLDWSVVAAVCVHKVPEGLALGALLLGAGYTRASTVLWVAAVEATTLLGGALGIGLLPGASPVWMYALLAHAGGGFLFLAAHAVLGEMMKHGKTLVISSFVGGALLIGLINWIAQGT